VLFFVSNTLPYYSKSIMPKSTEQTERYTLPYWDDLSITQKHIDKLAIMYCTQKHWAYQAIFDYTEPDVTFLCHPKLYRSVLSHRRPYWTILSHTVPYIPKLDLTTENYWALKKCFNKPILAILSHTSPYWKLFNLI